MPLAQTDTDSKNRHEASPLCATSYMWLKCSLSWQLFSHFKHEKDVLLPVCIPVCLFNAWDDLKVASQWLQAYGFSSLWIFMCTFRVEEEISFWHIWQGIVALSLWEFWCRFKFPCVASPFPHWGQMNCFSFVCLISWWFSRATSCVNIWLHWKQEKGFSLEWRFSWAFKLDEFASILPYFWH